MRWARGIGPEDRHSCRSTRGACSEYRLQSAWRGGRGIEHPADRRGDRGIGILSIKGGGRGIDIPVDQPEGGNRGIGILSINRRGGVGSTFLSINRRGARRGSASCRSKRGGVGSPFPPIIPPGEPRSGSFQPRAEAHGRISIIQCDARPADSLHPPTRLTLAYQLSMIHFPPSPSWVFAFFAASWLRRFAFRVSCFAFRATSSPLPFACPAAPRRPSRELPTRPARGWG